MGKSTRKNKQLPAVDERFPLWTLGLPFAEYHGIDEVNEKLKLQAWMEDGIYGDEDEVKLWYCTSEFWRRFLHFRNERQSGYTAQNIRSRLTRTRRAKRMPAVAAVGSEDTDGMFHGRRRLANGDDYHRNLPLGA